MNCSQMKMLLPAYASDELSAQERETVELHLAGCARCQSELTAITSLQNQLTLLQAMPLDTEIVDSVVSRIRWRTADTHAPEASMEPTDMLSSYTGEQPKKDRSDQGKKDAHGLPLCPDGKLIPDGGLQNEP